MELVRHMNSYFMTNILLAIKIKVAHARSRMRYALSSSIDILPVYPHSPSGPCSPGGPLGPGGPTSPWFPEKKRVIIEWLGFCSFFRRLWPTWISQIQSNAREKIQWKQYRDLLNVPRRTRHSFLQQLSLHSRDILLNGGSRTRWKKPECSSFSGHVLHCMTWKLYTLQS